MRMKTISSLFFILCSLNAHSAYAQCLGMINGILFEFPPQQQGPNGPMRPGRGIDYGIYFEPSPHWTDGPTGSKQAFIDAASDWGPLNATGHPHAFYVTTNASDRLKLGGIHVRWGIPEAFDPVTGNTVPDPTRRATTAVYAPGQAGIVHHSRITLNPSFISPTDYLQVRSSGGHELGHNFGLDDAPGGPFLPATVMAPHGADNRNLAASDCDIQAVKNNGVLPSRAPAAVRGRGPGLGVAGGPNYCPPWGCWFTSIVNCYDNEFKYDPGTGRCWKTSGRLVGGQQFGSADPPNVAPTITIDSPTNGSTAPSSGTIQVTAFDRDARVWKVEYYLYIGGVWTPIGESDGFPFSVGYQNAAPGSYTLAALAYDDVGATAVSNVITVHIGGGGGGLTPAVLPTYLSLWSHATGQYLAAQGDLLVANQASPQTLTAQSLGNGTYALRAPYNGWYVAAEGGGGGLVRVNRGTAMQWETFHAFSLGGADVVFRTYDGSHYLVVDPATGVVSATATTTETATRFRY